MNQTPPGLAADYIQKVLHLYRDLPETPLRVSFRDQNLAREFQLRGIPLELVESALLLGSLRRLLRPPGSLPLSPIRSLAYFQPVIEELLSSPSSDGYLDYLRLKMKPFIGEKLLACPVQKTTDSHDR
ncbi:MAG TPA: hypothetical protein VHM88_18355 [Candidatus Acidoferrales bacterium]|jgi:hypothetical protein|nr:hypothetical protein [Candidatus Acidoferrales bacterium]